nr:polymerase PA [Red mite quaranjavirus]
MDLHSRLLADTTLYPTRVVKLAQGTDPHWDHSTSREREESLRHDMVCMLLCNTKTLSDEVEERQKKIREEVQEDFERKTSSTSSGPSACIGDAIDQIAQDAVRLHHPLTGTREEPDLEAEEEEGDELAYFEEALGEIPSAVDLELEGEGPGISMEPATAALDEIIFEQKYRYVVLEGVSNCRYMQASYSNMWGKRVIGMFDILDIKNRKFIEVKVTQRNHESVISEIQKQKEGMDDADWGAYLISPLEPFNKTQFCCEPFPGEPMAIDFLMRRSDEVLKFAGEHPDQLDIDPSKGISLDPILVGRAEEWAEEIREHYFDPVGERDSQSKGDEKLEEWTPEGFLALLEDPRLRETEDTSKWKGKLLPSSWCEEIPLEMERDKDLVLKVLEEIDFASHETVNWPEERGQEFFNDVKLIKELFSDMESNFSVARVKRRKGKYMPDVPIEDRVDWERLMKWLGVGRKPYAFTGCLNEDMKAPPVVERPKLRWNDWMSSLFTTERVSSPSVLDDIGDDNPPPHHPLDKEAQAVFKNIHLWFRTSKAGATCSKYMGFHSRVGGGYVINISGSKTSHSSVAVMPIYYVIQGKDTHKRMVSGIAIRGPQHVTAGTDRINMIILEKMSDKLPREALNKGIIVDGKWWVRQTAIPREDSSYVTFLQNLLFVPANFCGEVLQRHPRANYMGIAAERNTVMQDSVLGHRDFYLDRIIENLIMGVTGNSQEEGYFAIYRMVFMLAHSCSSGRHAEVFSMSGLADAMNECLIDSAYAMWTHCGLIDFLKHVVANGWVSVAGH